LVRWEGYTAEHDSWVHHSGVSKLAVDEWNAKQAQDDDGAEPKRQARSRVVLEDDSESELDGDRSDLEGTEDEKE